MAFLLPHLAVNTIPIGPFVAAADGITALSALTIPASSVLLSTQGEAFLPSDSGALALPLGNGLYRVTLTPTDLARLGRVRVSVQMPTALPVWTDLLVVPADVYALLGGAGAVPVLLVGAETVIAMGPFVAEADGVTVQSTLAFSAAAVQVSSNEGPLHPSSTTTAPLAMGSGHYAVTLDPLDVQAVGKLRVQLDLPGSLVVWVDVMVGTPETYDFYTTALPGFPSPVPPGPLPDARRAVSSLYAGVSAILDDPQQLRADEALLLRTISQAQEWVALRYHLLLHSFLVDIVAGVPWLPLPVTQPRLMVVTEVLDATGSMLLPVGLTRLRYSDPQWLATTGTPTRYYRVGWTHIGLYKVPATSSTYSITGVCMPDPLVEGGQPLETPIAYDDAVMKVAAGLLLIGRERQYEKGIALITQALAVPQAQPATAGAAA